ncbi:uncharacterized protein LOC110444941 [Mizuhopecten yessoensis]|uniref:uncharacterized protein LOC110444941 n=1 Tax=Mizuhopecten yessoensis TaxID=6573 RepID=UPI000B457670|nr:uncharacterized protein LOC110444941 [Mizuhopecten yessoensis]
MMEASAVWFITLHFLSMVTITYMSVNMSRNPNVKTTNQSSTFNGATGSSKAVDGCTKQSLSSGCCLHTALQLKTAFWQIDLQGQVVMESVKIYFRDEEYIQKKRSGGYQIYGSNTTFWRRGFLCHIDTTATPDRMDLTPSISCKGTIRYLTIFIDRSKTTTYTWYSFYAVMEICEVEVYGMYKDILIRNI